jgi:ABC-type Co2+ transport system permease subunit
MDNYKPVTIITMMMMMMMMMMMYQCYRVKGYTQKEKLWKIGPT